MMGHRAARLIVVMLSAAAAAAEPAPTRPQRKLRRGNAYAVTMAEEALPVEELPKIVQGHPRLLIRRTPWRGGITLDQLRQRARQEPWKKWFDWAAKTKPKPKQWRPVRALYYLGTGDESVVPEIVKYVLAGKPHFNCGGGLVDYAIQYDWIHDSPSVSKAVRREMADHIAKLAYESAKVYESGWAFDLYTHRGSPGWAADVLVASLVLDDDHPEAKKLRAWAMGYWRKNYFRAWQHHGGCWLHGGSSYNIGMVLPRAVACWASAATDDVYETIRRDYGDWLQKHMVYLMSEVLPDRTRCDAVAWDYNPPGLRMPTLNVMMIARGYQDPDAYPYLRWLKRDPKCGPYGGLMQALFYDEKLDRAKPVFRPDSPSARLWGRRGAGYAQIRSKGWAPDATIIEFKCGDWTWTHTHQNHSNSFWIYHKGRLAVQSGIYDTYGGEHNSHYYSRSVSGNTMLVHKPGEFARGYRVGAAQGADEAGRIDEPGGQRMTIAMGQTCFTFDEYLRRKSEPNATGELFETGDITAFAHADDFSWTYVCGDATMAYNNPRFCYAYEGRKNEPKIDLYTRSMAWLGNRYLVIFDRVNALDPAYRKAWLCHFQGEPKISGKLVKAPVPGHIEDYDGDTVEMTWSGGACKPPDPDDPGRLFVRTFLPERRIIRRIGGAGHEFWANGKNRPPVSAKGGKQDMGRWRIEVSPARAAKFDNFLHLLYPCDTKTAKAPTAAMVTAEGETMVGLSAGDWLALFGRKGPATGEVVYRSPPGATKHLVVDLKRGGKYRVAGIAGGPRTLQAGEEGTLGLEVDKPGEIRITPVR